MKTRNIAAFLLAASAANVLLAADGTWTAGTGGDWSVVGNWQDDLPAEGAGSTAFINAGSGTITNDMTDLALLGVQFAGGGYTLAGNTVTLDSAGFITVLGGSHTVSAPLSLSGNTAVRAALNESLILDGALSGAGGVTANGGRVVLGNAANAYAGQTVLQTGLLEVASLDALGDYTGPVILGKGTFRYAGTAPGDLTQGYTVNSGGGNASTVLDVQTNLTVSGKVDVTGSQGRVLKTGPGTLTYTYPGFQVMNRTGSGTTPDATLVFDPVNGGAGTQGYQDFTVADGKIVFNTPGQTNRFYGMTCIGVRYPAAAQMEIGAGVVQNPDTWFAISRGNGDTNTPYSSGLTMTGGRLEARSFVMGYNAGMPGFKSYPTLTQTGGDIVISDDAYVPETGGAVATVNITGGTLTQNGLNQGFDVGRSGTAGTVMNVAGGAVVSLAKLRVNSGTFTVSSGGTLALRSTASENKGTVYFDNATLTTYAPQGQPSEWFHGTSKLYVKSGGLTAGVPSGQYAFLASTPQADPASPGGQITKTGDGTLALYNAEMPVQVNAGTLRLMGAHISTNKLAKTISVAAGASLELAAPHAAEADTLAMASGAGINLTVSDWAARAELWKVNSAAIARTDGALELAPASGVSAVGSVFMTRPISVTNAWQASFSLAAVAGRAYGYQGDGVAFVIQNDTRGTSAYSTNLVTGSFGYAGGAAPVANSFALALDITNRRLLWGTNGVFTSTTYDLSLLSGLGSDMDKTYFNVAYDGAGTVTCTITRKGLQTLPYAFPADLQALAGATQAYLGFTAGNTAARCEEHLVRDVAFVNGSSAAAKTFVQYGGSVALAGGQTLGVALNPAPAQNGFGLGTLTYADGSVLDVSQPTFAPTPAPTLSDQGMWQLNGKANWKTDGRLAVSTNANDSPGSAFTTNLYPVTGSWTASFHYDIGQISSPPADYITFAIQNQSPTSSSHTPSPGFAIMWRYYEGGVTTTSLRMFTNNVAVLATTNIAPVSLKDGGPAVMTVTHDASAKTVTVITEQAAGAFTNVFTGVDMMAAVKSANAYLGFGAFTGGLYAENIVSDFSFVSQGGAFDTSWQRGYLAVGAASGSGTLVKKGNGALGIQDGPDNPFTNATVRLDEGGLVLRKFVSEPVTLGDDFYLSRWASWAPGGALQTMYTIPNSAGNAATAKRRYVTGAWTARYTFFVGARNGAADGFSFFIHNDSRGPSALGGAYSGSGYTGIANSIALGWNYYEGNSMSNTVNYGENGSWNAATRVRNLPVRITSIQLETDMEIRHDPDAQTLALKMWQGTNVFQTVFSNVNIQARLGGDYGYIGFGDGCGGQQCEARVKDFRLALDTPTNPLPVTACLDAAVLPGGSTNTVSLDTVVPNAGFAIGSAQIGAGATLALESVQSNGGSLTVNGATLTGDAAFAVGSGATLALTSLTGGGSITKTGSGTLALTGDATYTADTVLAAGTLSLAAPVLPKPTDLYVTPGATLNLAFDGKQFIHSLYIDGVMQHGGVYTSANTSWITGDGVLVVTFPPVGSLIKIQ